MCKLVRQLFCQQYRCNGLANVCYFKQITLTACTECTLRSMSLIIYLLSFLLANPNKLWVSGTFFSHAERRIRLLITNWNLSCSFFVPRCLFVIFLCHIEIKSELFNISDYNFAQHGLFLCWSWIDYPVKWKWSITFPHFDPRFLKTSHARWRQINAVRIILPHTIKQWVQKCANHVFLLLLVFLWHPLRLWGL